MKYLSPIILILLLLACDEGEAPDPQQFIMGKWETIAKGNWPKMWPAEPAGFTEFGADSIGRFYDYDESTYTSQFLYWMTDSILTEVYPRVDQDPIIVRRRYYLDRDRIEGDRMRLDMIDINVMFRTLELRRIE